ncbi:YVTN beta-propeller repeat-containing protein, partial [mine drainage metagenome]
VHSVNIGSSGLIPEPQVYDNEAGSVFATSAISNTVIALNGGSNDVTSVTKVGNNQCPNGAVFDPLNGDVYVSEECSKNLTVIDGGTGQVVATIPSVPPGQGLTYDPASNSVYVAANTGRPNATVVTVINATTNTVNTYIPLFHAYWGATYDSINGDVYVTGSSSDNVTIINASLNQVVANVPTPN